jgi:hypothetical protein
MQALDDVCELCGYARQVHPGLDLTPAPAPTGERMMQSKWPKRAGEDTVAMEDVWDGQPDDTPAPTGDHEYPRYPCAEGCGRTTDIKGTPCETCLWGAPLKHGPNGGISLEPGTPLPEPDEASAPTGDPPTWTIDKGVLLVSPRGYGMWNDDEFSMLMPEEYAALVEAVHRSQQLDTALDVIAEFVDAEREMHLLDREYEEAVDQDYDFDSQGAALDRAITARHRYTDAHRAVLALAERRHRD